MYAAPLQQSKHLRAPGLHSMTHRCVTLVDFWNCSMLPCSLSGSCSSVLTCKAGTGVCQEYITHGRSEGGLNDVQQLDSLLRALRVRAPHSVRYSLTEALLFGCAAPCCTCTAANA